MNPSTLERVKDPYIRSQLERLRLTVSSAEEHERTEAIIAMFDAAPGDETPNEVAAFVQDSGVYIDEDARRRRSESANLSGR